MPEIQKADPKARRKAILSVLLGAVTGVGLYFVIEFTVGNVNHWLQANTLFLVEHHYLTFFVMLLLVSPILGGAAYLIHFTRKIIKTKRFPPPATPVIRDVRVSEGKAAVRRGWLLQILCWLILLPALTIPFLVWFIFYTVSCVS
jgi:hypothetical protein